MAPIFSIYLLKPDRYMKFDVQNSFLNFRNRNQNSNDTKNLDTKSQSEIYYLSKDKNWILNFDGQNSISDLESQNWKLNIESKINFRFGEQKLKIEWY